MTVSGTGVDVEVDHVRPRKISFAIDSAGIAQVCDVWTVHACENVLRYLHTVSGRSVIHLDRFDLVARLGLIHCAGWQNHPCGECGKRRYKESAGGRMV